ncbi:cation:proton antiporter [Pediococcus claussenii]|uniref:Sodium/hydrogen exchanger family protein n=1 Tax=Pediococcus claussenii (strain ATCC BAA-344 / DSM 14800 / JCM 18046 / KCTC 3811 / LMG 21948 / P06) TaxID=701521 RepID=G8PAP5_PEDCP|nr:sodium:proton antiporter [Pediococcus claussenii]AEV94604.1 sodium/hydrogen exchanger family protein [Pediococcus claussenii ATCC BAA-344]KRN20784.1 hypothetical protein IV79_GL000004 [Pediococcus claussenii]
MVETFFPIILLVGVVASIMIQNHIKAIPLPIVFIVVGMLFSMLPLYQHFTFDPTLFLFLIVAPFLYNDAQSASRYWIGRGAINIFSLSIMLVIFTVIGVGIVVHSIFSIIPLALVIALSAIVTPTDATSVSAFSFPNKNLQIPYIILQNESLFNDATGFVTLNIAVAMYLSGTFSIGAALVAFLIEFGGGLLFGVIIGVIIHAIRSLLISLGDDSPLVMVSIEMIVPFIAYFVADGFGFSGILAVVAAGLIQGSENDNLQLTSSRMQLVRSNAWEIIEQALTGVIFILLGISLPTIIIGILNTGHNLLFLLVMIALSIYTVKFVIRLLWTRYLVWMHIPSASRWKDSWIMALSGASGTISLALAFLLPKSINENSVVNRNSMIFIISVVIIVSLTIAAVTVPKPTRPKKNKDLIKPVDKWVREMIMVAMNTVRKEKEHQVESDIVVDALSQQLHAHKFVNRRERHQIYRFAYKAEINAVNELLSEKKITQDEHKYYLEFLALSFKTVTGGPLTNLLLRFRFGFNIGKLYRDINSVQEMFLTSPLLAEQFYWVNQFESHDEDIMSIEKVGFDAVMSALKEKFHGQSVSLELHDVRSFYRERHRRMYQSTPNPKIFYQLFLEAFHAEFEFLQNTIRDGKIGMDTAEALQEHIIYDQMALIQNDSVYTQNYEIKRYDK